MKKKRYKDISLQNRKNDSCIVRCIERGAEADGPKFYKFNVRKDGFDLYNKVKSLYTTRKQESINDGDEPENILDIYKGKDLKLTIKPGPNKSEANIMKSVEYATRFAMMLRRFNITYSSSAGMMLPGFLPEVGDMFGQSRSTGNLAPGLDRKSTRLNSSH